jgi:hypothetical protein
MRWHSHGTNFTLTPLTSIMRTATPEEIRGVLAVLSPQQGNIASDAVSQVAQLERLLKTLPAGAVRRYGTHTIVDLLAMRFRIRGRFRADGSITSLVITDQASERRVVDWSEQAWLRAELEQQGVDAPRAATLWRHPVTGSPLCFDWRSGVSAFAAFHRLQRSAPVLDAPALLDASLEALVHGGAREHAVLGEFCCGYGVGHWYPLASEESSESWGFLRLQVRYAYAGHVVTRLQIERHGQPLLAWQYERL